MQQGHGEGAMNGKMAGKHHTMLALNLAHYSLPLSGLGQGRYTID